MAIDTRAKRSSVQAYALGFTLPPPDGTIAEGDRAHVSFLYSGMNYASPAAPVPALTVRRALLRFIGFR